MTLRNRALLLVGVFAFAGFATTGCELLVNFDRSLIPSDGGTEDGSVDASSDMVDFGSTLAHLDYLVGLIGFDHVGIGTDLEMTDPKYPAIIRGITAGLLQRKYSEANIRKILGENFLRLFSENEASAG